MRGFFCPIQDITLGPRVVVSDLLQLEIKHMTENENSHHGHWLR